MKDIIETAFMFTSFAGAVALVGGGVLFLVSVFAVPALDDGRDAARYEASIVSDSEHSPA